ncbi:hypothetical protein [Microbispora triticiradicis]|uniref:hypothetical protein n=1 Tax=Microbispora triticiradicis TaxID=2200763 RepID=UPI001058AE22|nr:hypothetical protein [Microbispora triticiradicis]
MTSPLTGQRSRSELIAELFERHAAGLFAYCHDQLGETASAADAVVAVFTTAPAAAEPPSRAVLYALARREIYRRDVSYALPAVDSVADPATALIERVFRDIRPHQREVLLLSEVCGLTPPELSLVLDVAVDTAEELAAGAKRRFTQTLATAVAAARSAPFVPPSVAEVYDAIGVAPVADVLARLPWRHPSASVRNRVLAALPYEEPGDPAATGTEQVADESGAQPGSGGLVTKRLWPTTPTWPLPLSDPDQVTNTCVVKTEALTPQEPRRRAKHEATTEPMPRLRGALLNSLTEGRLRRKRATRPEPRSQETRSHETRAREAQAREAQAREAQAREAQAREAQAREAQAREAQAREAQAREAQARESRAQGTSAQESPGQEALAAPMEPRTPPRFPSPALSDAPSQAPSQASTPSRSQSQASSQPPGSQPPGAGLPESASGVPVPGFGVPESARSAGQAGHGGSVAAEGPATDRSAVEWFKAEGFEAERFDADRFEADRFEADRFDAFRPADPFDAFAPATPPGVARPADPPPAPAVFADDPQRQTPGERRDFDAFAPAGPLLPGESFDAFAPPGSLPPGEPFDAFTPPGPATAATPAEPFEAAHTLLFETLRSAEPFDAFAAPAEAPARPAGEPAAQPASDVTADAAAGPDSRLVTEAASPPEASGPTEAFRPAESTAIPQTVFPEAVFPEAVFPETGFPQAEFPEFPEAEFPQFPETQFPRVEEQVKHPVGGYPAAFPEDDAPGTPETNSAPTTNGAQEAGGEQAVDAPAATADVDPVPDPAVTPAAASAAPATVPAAVPAASPVAPARKDGKRPAKKRTTKKQTAKKQTTTRNAGSAGNAEATGVRPAGKGPRKKSDRHYDWLWEVVGFLICLIIALVVFFTVPTIVTH